MDFHTKDPLLGKYDPLERILLAHDFENGMQGWQTYCYGQEFNVAGQKIKIWDPEDPVIKEHGWEWAGQHGQVFRVDFPQFPNNGGIGPEVFSLPGFGRRVRD